MIRLRQYDFTKRTYETRLDASEALAERAQTMTDLLKQHVTRYAGATYLSGDHGMYCIEYGALRDVYADQACNYSYREFWF